MTRQPMSIDHEFFSKWEVLTKLEKIRVSNDGIHRWNVIKEMLVDSAWNLIGGFPRNSNLLLYYVCLQKAEVLYANGEFELGEISNAIDFSSVLTD